MTLNIMLEMIFYVSFIILLPILKEGLCPAMGSIYKGWDDDDDDNICEAINSSKGR